MDLQGIGQGLEKRRLAQSVRPPSCLSCAVQGPLGRDGAGGGLLRVEVLHEVEAEVEPRPAGPLSRGGAKEGSTGIGTVFLRQNVYAARLVPLHVCETLGENTVLAAERRQSASNTA